MNANMRKSRVGVAVTILAAAMFWTTGAAGAALTWYVSQWNGVPGTDCGAARHTPAGAFQTIEAAVDCANLDSGDTIKIEAAGVTQFEYFIAHTLVIGAKMSIVGTGPGFAPATATTVIPAIDAGGKFRVVENVSPATSITSVEIDNGLADKGGGIWNHPKGAGVTLTDVMIDANSAQFGGGIYNEGTVIASNTTISDNESTGGNIDACTRSGGVTGRGGGIYNDGTAGGPGGNLTLSFVTIEANTASSAGCADGGGLFNDGGLITIQDSLVQGNSALANGAGAGGGGIANFAGSVSVERTHVTDNKLQCPIFIASPATPCGAGAGIINLDTLTVKDNAFVSNNGPISNSGPIQGGGVYTSNGSTLNIKFTVTFSSNTTGTFAGPGEGGGIYNYGLAAPVGQVNFASNSTTNFAFNSAGQCGGTGTYKPSGQAKIFNSGVSMSNCPF